MLFAELPCCLLPLLNNNIGCFEINDIYTQLYVVAQLNNNIGCFEIKYAYNITCYGFRLNNNIGCFEICIVCVFAYCSPIVKQQHRMF